MTPLNQSTLEALARRSTTGTFSKVWSIITVIVIFVSYWKSYTIKPSIWFFFQWVFPLQNKEYLEGEWSCADGRSWLWIHKVPTIGIALGFVRCFYLMALWPVHLCVSTIYMWCCKLSFRLFEWLVSFKSLSCVRSKAVYIHSGANTSSFTSVPRLVVVY